MTDHTGVIYTENDTELLWLMDQVSMVMKTRKANYVTNGTNAIYDKNETQLPWSIKLGVVYEKKLDRRTTWQIV